MNQRVEWTFGRRKRGAGSPWLSKIMKHWMRPGLWCFLAFLFFVHLADSPAVATKGPAARESTTTADAGQKKHFLIITSQPYETDWFLALKYSMRGCLLSALSSESKVSYEYIGGEGVTDSQYDEELTHWLKKKYARIHLDMIIAIMPASCQFALDYGKGLFPGVPIIYALPAKDQIHRISTQPRSAVVKSASDPIPETIRQIHSICPDADHLLVVSGSGKDDLHYQQVVRGVLQGKAWPKTVEYVAGAPAAELSEKLGRLPDRYAVLMLTYLQDRDGKPLTTLQVMKAIAERSRAPIFSFYDTVFGSGIVGGRLSSAETYGETIAEAALGLLEADGRVPLPAIEAKGRNMYDWRQLEKWKIPQDRLPKDSDIRYRQESFWRRHLAEVLLVTGVIVIEAVLIVALIINLRRRRRAEARLRDSEKKFRDIFENAVMGIYQSTPDGAWLSVNPTMAAIFGYRTPEEMIADIKDIQNQSYVHPEDRTRLKKLYEMEDVVRGFQAEFKRKDGSRFWVSIHGKAIRDDQGRIRYYEGTVEDITEHKQAANELAKYREHLEQLVKERTAELEVAKEAAETADRLKSAFLATMSHELRTPLNSIIGFTGILIQGLAGPVNEEQTKQLGMVRRSASHLLSLINDILDISKIEAEQLTLAMAPFDIRQSIHKAMNIVTPLADAKALPIQATVADEVSSFTGDQKRVEQIMINLLSNAIKFTEKGRVSLSCMIENGCLLLSVSDTGIGIRPEDQEKVFRPFQQVDTGLTRKYEGTGLGLPIVKKLAQQMGGEITVRSELDVGSVFTVALPLKKGNHA